MKTAKGAQSNDSFCELCRSGTLQEVRAAFAEQGYVAILKTAHGNRTALHFACCRLDAAEEIVGFLLANYANPMCADDNGDLPIHLARH